MGTNYYFDTPDTDHCAHCGRSTPGRRLHIGKASEGWVFALRVHPEIGIFDFENWKARFETGEGQIIDEYGTRISTEEMLTIIQCRSWSGPLVTSAWGILGPNNLLRCKELAGDTWHGAGTWDCINHEFS